MNKAYFKLEQKQESGPIIRINLLEPVEGAIEAKYAMRSGYSDVEPYEIIMVSNKVMMVRAMECEQIADMGKNFQPGGFVGHFENSDQRWKISSNPNGSIQTLTLRSDGQWRTKGCSKNQSSNWSLSDVPHKHYDYNF